VSLASADGGADFISISGSANIDTIDAGDDNDSITVTAGTVDSINAGIGNDSIAISGGSIGTITAGEGTDTITVSVDGNVSLIQAEGGSDFISIGSGASIDTIDAGAASDSIVVSGGTIDSINAGTEADSIVISGGSIGTISAGSENDTISISGGNVSLIQAEGGSDFISIGSGANIDTIDAGADNDSIVVAGGTIDSINAGSDNDSIVISGGSIGTISAGAGTDTISISGVGANVSLVQGEGDTDFISIGSGANIDTIDAGAANDSIVVAGGTIDSINAGIGNDSIVISGGSIGTISAGTENDTISISGGNVSLAQGEAGTDFISIGSGANIDTIDAGADNDSIVVAGGTIDSINAGSENDSIVISGGSIGTISAGTENDTISISGGNVSLAQGEAGTDFISISNTANIDTIDAGADNDSIVVSGGTIDSINAGTEADSIVISGGSIGTISAGTENDTISISGGNVSLAQGEAGTDFISISNTANIDTIDAGADNDSIVVSGGTIDSINAGTEADSIVISGGSIGTISAGTESDTISISGGNVSLAQGEDGDDSFSVTGGTTNTIDAGAGNDTISIQNSAPVSLVLAGAGSDLVSISASATYSYVVDAGTGDDTVYSGLGNDSIVSSDGNNFIEVQGGNNTISVAGFGNNTIQTSAASGNTGNDSIVSTSSGNDSIVSGGGNDTIDVYAGNNTISSGIGNDLIFTGTGNDSVLAGTGDDTIFGSTGDDTIIGGGGSDYLTYERLNAQLLVQFSGTEAGTVQSYNSISEASTADGDFDQRLTTSTGTLLFTDQFSEINDGLRLSEGDDRVVFAGPSNSSFGTTINAAGGGLDILDYSGFGEANPVLVSLTSNSSGYSVALTPSITFTVSQFQNAQGIGSGLSSAADAGKDGFVQNFEGVIGGNGSDTIVGSSANNFLVGNGGDDTIAGVGGSNTIFGGEGNDIIIPGANGDNKVDAGSGYNIFYVNAQNLTPGNEYLPNAAARNEFKLIDAGATTTGPAGDWDPGAQGINVLSGGDANGSDYRTLEASNGDDTWTLSGTALSNIGYVDLGNGNDYVSTATVNKGTPFNVTYNGGAGTNEIELNLTFGQFALLTQAGRFGSDILSYTDAPGSATFSSDLLNINATNFQSASVGFISPAAFNLLLVDPTATTQNRVIGTSGGTVLSGGDLSIDSGANARTEAIATSTPFQSSALADGTQVAGALQSRFTAGADLSGVASANQQAGTLATSVAERAEAVTGAFGFGADRSDFSAAGSVSLQLTGRVAGGANAGSAATVVQADSAMDVAGGIDANVSAAASLSLDAAADSNQFSIARNVSGLSVANLRSSVAGLADTALGGSANFVSAGDDARITASASGTNSVLATSVGGQSLPRLSVSIPATPAESKDVVVAGAAGAPFPFLDGDLVVFNTSSGQNSSGEGGVVAGRRYYVSDVNPGLRTLRLRDYASTVSDRVTFFGAAGSTITIPAADAFRPGAAMADASAMATAVDLNRSLLAGAGVSSGAELSLDASASQLLDVRATSVTGEAVAGLNRLGGQRGAIGSDSPAWSQVTAIDASVITAASNTDLRASASESASLVASTTNGSSLTEASARVLGISSSPVTAGDNLNAITSATLSLNGQALSTAGSARALSGAGAGAATSTNASAATLADTTSQVIGLRQANQSAGADLNLNASADLELTALARTVDGSRRLDFIQANGDSGQETFFAPNSGLVQGDLVQLSGATPQTADLIPDTNYWVRDLAFGAIGSGNTITMPNGVSYTNGMTVVFRLNDAAAANLVDESVTLSVNGITLGRTYFVTGASGGTFQIAETAGGTAVPLTSSNSLPSGLIDGERFQLSSAADPFAPVVNLADGATANISFSQIATASAFAGGRPSTTNIGSAARLDPSLERAQVLGISGNHSAGHSISSGADATVIAAAAANLDSRAINVASPASAGAAANVTGIDGVMIAAAADGSVRATAAADAQVAATTTGSSANSDFALANTLVDVIGIRSRGAADTTTIAADGTITAAARIGSGTTASTVVGNSDALAILNATAISLANAGASTTIGGVGSISASADLGSLAAPILVSATSAANGIARANLAGDAIGIFGTANGSDYPLLQPGAAGGDLTATAVTSARISAFGVAGAAEAFLADGADRTAPALLIGIQDTALAFGAGTNTLTVSTTGVVNLTATSTAANASAGAVTSGIGLFGSNSATPVSIDFDQSGRIAIAASQRSFAQAVSVNGVSIANLVDQVVGIESQSILAAGTLQIGGSATSQQLANARSEDSSASASVRL